MKTPRTPQQLLLTRPTCNCSTCDCVVSVRSSVQICKACRHGAHNLRALRRLRGGVRPPQAA